MLVHLAVGYPGGGCAHSGVAAAPPVPVVGMPCDTPCFPGCPSKVGMISGARSGGKGIPMAIAGLLSLSSSWMLCCVCMQAHTEQYTRSADHERMFAARCTSSL